MAEEVWSAERERRAQVQGQVVALIVRYLPF